MAQAFILGKDFIGNDSVCLVLGDNLFYGHGFVEVLTRAAQLREGALIFGYRVAEPQHYGVVEFDATGQVVSLEEKPSIPKSNYAVPGIYFYDSQVLISCTWKFECQFQDLRAKSLRRSMSCKIRYKHQVWKYSLECNFCGLSPIR